MLIHKVYKNVTMMVKLHENPIPIPYPKYLSLLWNVFQKLNWEVRGLNINGENLTNLLLADDVVLLPNNLKDIQPIPQGLLDVRAEVHLQINISNTKFITNLVPSETINVDIREAQKYGYQVITKHVN